MNFEMEKIKVGSDFSGVGAFNQALTRLGINYQEIFACDKDKYARQTFIHNYGEPEYFPTDVYERKIPKESLDIYMTSPPCQAFSLAGKRLGKEDKRGILFFNSHEFIQENKPRFFIFENVKGLLSDDSGKTFSEWINLLGGKSVNGNPVLFPHENSVPYHVYYQVMNAKHYGVPQNRERIFIIGIRDDADNTFSFPKPFHLVKRLKDVLESEVDEKYFLSDTMLTWIDKHREKRSSSGKYPFTEEDDYTGCITARYNKMGAEDIFIGVIRGRNPQNTLSRVSGLPTEQMLEINENGTSNALTTVQKDNVVIIPANNSKGYDIAEEEEDSINFSNPNSETRRGRVGHGVAQTLDTGCNQGTIVKPLQIGQSEKTFAFQNGTILGKEDQEAFCIRASQPNGVFIDYKIRRLTPRECFRLMDFPDSFTWPVSDSQAYKQAGNSIVVACLEGIISKLNL